VRSLPVGRVQLLFALGVHVLFRRLYRLEVVSMALATCRDDLEHCEFVCLLTGFAACAALLAVTGVYACARACACRCSLLARSLLCYLPLADLGLTSLAIYALFGIILKHHAVFDEFVLGK
jgi:hypothetical protein